MAATPQRSFAEVRHLSSYTSALPRIADGLAAECAKNDALDYTPGHPQEKYFRFAEYAKVSVTDLLVRLCKYTKVSPNVFIAMAIMVDRLRHALQLPVRSDNVHQYVMAAFLLAVKLTEDIVFRNKDYAVIPGYDLTYLNDLEVVALGVLDWHVFIEQSTFEKYRYELTAAASPRGQRQSFRRASSQSAGLGLTVTSRRSSNASSLSAITPMNMGARRGSSRAAPNGTRDASPNSTVPLLPRIPSVPVHASPTGAERAPRRAFERIRSIESVESSLSADSPDCSPGTDYSSPSGAGHRAARIQQMRRASLQRQHLSA